MRLSNMLGTDTSNTIGIAITALLYRIESTASNVIYYRAEQYQDRKSAGKFMGYYNTLKDAIDSIGLNKLVLRKPQKAPYGHIHLFATSSQNTNIDDKYVQSTYILTLYYV